SGGTLTVLPWDDPYGADSLDNARIPAMASLFPDPATRLYHAGSRWFDPRTAQFLTPDGWFGTDYWNHIPPCCAACSTRFPAAPTWWKRRRRLTSGAITIPSTLPTRMD